MTWSSDGDKHDRRCIVVAIAIGGAVTFLGQPALSIKMATTIIIWGLLFSPDLDLADTGRHQGGGCKAWHRWKRMGLGWLWKPYGHAFKHRSPFTHSLIPGTLLRLLYVLALPIAFWIWKTQPDLMAWVDWNAEQIEQFKEQSISVFTLIACCFIADIVHLITDRIHPKDWLQ